MQGLASAAARRVQCAMCPEKAKFKQQRRESIGVVLLGCNGSTCCPLLIPNGITLPPIEMPAARAGCRVARAVVLCAYAWHFF